MRFTILIAVILFPLLANASGSLYLSDIEPLLKQQPELWASLKTSFDIEDVGTAPRINVRVSQKLDGMRIAPYTFDAKPKGSKGPFIFAIEIRAKTRYYDSKGKEVAVEKAVSVKEELESVVIRKRPQSEIDEEAEFLRNPNAN